MGSTISGVGREKMKKYIGIVVVLVSCLTVGCSNPVEDGTALLKEKKYDEAIEAFDTAIQKEKQISEAYRGRGIAYWELEEYEKARDAFKEAIDQGAERTGTIFNFIGMCNMKLEEWQEAINYFNLGLSVEGNSKQLVQEMEFNEISVYERMGDWENAKAKIKDYIVKYPDDEKAAKEAEFLETR